MYAPHSDLISLFQSDLSFVKYRDTIQTPSNFVNLNLMQFSEIATLKFKHFQGFPAPSGPIYYIL